VTKRLSDFRIVLIFIPPIRRSSFKQFFEQNASFAQILDLDTMLCNKFNVDTIQDAIANHSRKTLQEKWNDTLKLAFDMMKQDDKKIKIVLSHPVYYKIVTREFFSVFNSADFTSLTKDDNSKISHVIHIIDDVYDVFARLQEPKELFGDVAISEFMENYVKSFHLKFKDLQKNTKAYVSWIQNCINSILIWRSQELLFTQNVATQFNCKFLLWAIKQDPSVLLDWIQTDVDVFYISHPISEPRRLQKKRNNWPTMVEYLNNFQFELRKKKVYTVMPTAIDEYRFDKNNKGFTGDLTSRWPIPKNVKKQFQGNKIIPPNSDWKNLLAPVKLTFGSNLYSITNRTKTTTNLIHDYANAAFNSIEMQITQSLANRDHTLVWHTNGVIVIEPYDPENGKLHGGVNKELDYLRGVNDSIEKETQPGKPPQYRKLCAIFLDDTFTQIIDHEDFQDQYISRLVDLVSKKESIAKAIVQFLIDKYGKLNLGSTSLGGRISSTQQTNLMTNMPTHQQDAILDVFLLKALAMSKKTDSIGIIIIPKISSLTSIPTINVIESFLVQGKSLQWETKILSYVKKSSYFKKFTFYY